MSVFLLCCAFLRRAWSFRAVAGTVVFLGGALPAQAWLFGTSWPDLTEEELNLSAPKIDPEAGAEILYREVTVDDRTGRRSATYFNRVKIFDERGVEAMSRVELSSWDGQEVYSVKARVIRPDGSIEELERQAVHTQDVMKAGRFEASRTSFALPGLVPGCIVDYKWTVATDELYYDYRLFACVHLPTHRLRFRFRSKGGGRWLAHGLPEDAVQKAGGHWNELNLTDLPARPYEPFQPPPSVTGPWVAFYYIHRNIRGSDWGEKFWKERANGLWDSTRKDITSRPPEIRTKAEELTAGLENDDEKLRALYLFCVDEIKNIHSDRAGYSIREVEELDDNNSAKEVLKDGYGRTYYIKALFGSLAKAAGFEVRFALCSDRSRYIFSRDLAFWSALPALLVAVRSESQDDEQAWRFFDPGTAYVPFGRLHWTNESAVALLGDRSEATFIPTGNTPAADSLLSRQAELTLDAEGTLSGVVTLTYTGHLAALEKAELDGETPSERQESVEAEFRENLPEAEISDLTTTNVTANSEPLEIRFKLTVPRFAERTSTRLLFEPAVFQQGSQPIFEEEKRETAIFMPFVWTERDHVTITLPAEFELEEPSAPKGAVDINLLRHKLRTVYDPSVRTLTFERELELNMLAFRAEGYPQLKAIFDAIDQQDHYLLVLRRVEAESPSSEKAPSSSSELSSTAEAPLASTEA